MPAYLYRCEEHGIQEVYQGMNDPHTAQCVQCGAEMVRVYTPSAVKCGPVKMGNTRGELFDNLAAEGFANKNWKEHDTYYQKATGEIA